MPATRSIPVRRHSSYDPTIFNPPLDLGPAACRFYSWPIESQVSHSQLDDEPRVTTVAGRELAMDPGTSSGDEEVDQLENDNQLENDDQIENEEPGAFDPGEDEEWETDTPDVSPDLQQSTARASALPTTRPAAQPSITTWNTAIYPDQLRATNQLTATITQIALPRPKSVAPTASRSIDALSPHRVTTRSNAPFSAAHRDPKKTNARKTAITRYAVVDMTSDLAHRLHLRSGPATRTTPLASLSTQKHLKNSSSTSGARLPKAPNRSTCRLRWPR